jgi:hypothetical protein
MWFTISKFKPDHEAQCRLIGPAFCSALADRDCSKAAVKRFPFAREPNAARALSC